MRFSSVLQLVRSMFKQKTLDLLGIVLFSENSLHTRPDPWVLIRFADKQTGQFFVLNGGIGAGLMERHWRGMGDGLRNPNILGHYAEHRHLLSFLNLVCTKLEFLVAHPVQNQPFYGGLSLFCKAYGPQRRA